MKFSIEEVWLYPTEIASESVDYNIYNKDGKLPVFTSVEEPLKLEEYIELSKLGINTIIPQSISLEKRLSMIHQSFIDLSYHELNNLLSSDSFTSNFDNTKTYYIYIEYTPYNGKQFFHTCKYIKRQFGGNVLLMVSNIGSPELYLECCKTGIDYAILVDPSRYADIKFSYPSGSLITDCKSKQWEIQETIKSSQNVGIFCPYTATSIIHIEHTLNQIPSFRSLVLGADYVMTKFNSSKLDYNTHVKAIETKLFNIMQYGGIRTLSDFEKIKYIVK